MIRSMTGYGRAQGTANGKDILVEIRSVNNRYYDFTARIPRMYGYLEEKLKSFLQGGISRGKVEVSVLISNNEVKDEQIEINRFIAKGYIDALRGANEELNLADDLSLSHLIKLPDVFNVKKIIEDEELVWSSVKIFAEEALNKFIKMRETEGEKMKADILERIDLVWHMVESVEGRSPETVQNYRNKLFARLKEVLSDNNIDEQRILFEAAVFAEKIAVDEETVRLKSHMQQFKALMESKEPVGRKLDFLVQEMNREANTIGSKSQDIEITKLVVDIKSEIEK
ncbi:MAG TPA: YicC family protein, partial [Oscillospiraceae bacterium]|nr:YicC family protein [Oscillospiraceae bacterium]